MANQCRPQYRLGYPEIVFHEGWLDLELGCFLTSYFLSHRRHKGLLIKYGQKKLIKCTNFLEICYVEDR